jgi:RNase P subunit RPR2
MIASRNKLKSSLHDARIHSSQILQTQDEIHAYEEEAKQYDDDKDKYKHFTKQIQEKTVKIPAKYHSTICSNCNYVCHDGCSLEETIKKNNQIFRHCWALVDGKGCRCCPQGCDYTQHYHDRDKIIITTPSRTEIIQEIKSKYDQATKNKDVALDKINTLTGTKNLLEKALLQQTEDIKEECKRLKDICSNFDLSNELLIMINQIETESLKLHSLESKQQANNMIASLKDIYNRMHEEYTIKRKKPKMNVIDTYRPRSTRLPKNIDPLPQPHRRIPGGISNVQKPV